MKTDVYSSLDELTLQQKVADKDEKAIAFVYRKNYDLIRSMVRKFNQSIDPQDVYQESMMVLVNTLYDKKLTCKISTFLYSVARNVVLKTLRDDPMLETAEVVDVAQEVEDYQNDDNRRNKLNKALKELGDKCKSILQMFYMQSMRMEEIALRLGYTNAENAKNQKYKCFKQLKKLMTNEG